MDQTLKQVGELLLGAIPTIVILLLLYVLYRFLVLNPLRRVQAERRERTEGAIVKARANVAAAEARTQEYEQRLRDARAAIYKAQEVRRQQAQHAREQLLAQARESAQQQVREARAALERDMVEARASLAGRKRAARRRNHPHGSEARRNRVSRRRPGMKRHFFRRLSLLLFIGLALGVPALHSQDAAAHPASQQPAQQPEAQTAPGVSEHPDASAEPAAGGPNDGIGAILEGTTERAAHTAEAWGKRFGLGRDTSYWISLVLNFAGIALLFYVLLKSKLPQMFRDRTTEIQKAIRDAQAASAEAAQRLSGIEARLAKLDTEISEIRSSAEREAVAEEARIRQAAEEDKQKVVAAAEAEIASIARNARRELKSYAASLAVDLAARRINVDEHTDRALVHEFVDHFGKDGK